MSLNAMMRQGVGAIMKTAGRYYLNNRKGREFLADTLPRIKRSAELRDRNEDRGMHVPVFLIASVASQCNLHCAGCYARTGGTCTDIVSGSDLDGDEWGRVFAEASGLGVSFVLIAGGEPLMRRDVIEAAGKHKDLVFPLFTNGTMLDEDYLSLFDDNRNLVPVISIDGDAAQTDARRGGGAYEGIAAAMDALNRRSILFGASITVTRENIDTVLTNAFLGGLRAKGCGVVIFVEYVPIEAGTEHLSLTETDLARLEWEAMRLKSAFKDMVVLSFPGDEEAMGGCLASGRGFFHINPKGGAEPCPFSPYSRHNVRDDSLEAVLRSDYFSGLREIAAKAGPHTGGCTLFAYEDEVRLLFAQ